MDKRHPKMAHRPKRKRVCKNAAEPLYIYWIKNKQDPPGTEVKFVSDVIGNGLFATKTFQKDTFIVEYGGKLLRGNKCNDKEETKNNDYKFYFKHREITHCIDAYDSMTNGRYANDAKGLNENATVRKVVVDGNPHLIIMSKTEILAGEEIRYDYGNPNAPWRASINISKAPEPTAADTLIQDTVMSPVEPVQVISKAPEPTPADTLIQDTVTSPVEPVQVISKAPEPTPADTLIQDTVASPVEPVQVISKAPEPTPADTLIQDTVTSPVEPVQVISKAPESTPADTLIQDTVTSPDEPVQVISKAPEPTPADTLIQDTVTSPVEPVQVISKAPESTPADTLIQDTVTSPVEPVQVISKAPESTPADTLIQDTVTSPDEPVQVISKAPEPTAADTLIQDTVMSPVEPVQVISKAPEPTPADTLIQDTVTSPVEPVQVISKAPEPTPADTLIQDTVASPVEPVQVISKAPEPTPADTLIQDTVTSPVEPVQVISKAPESTPADTLIQDTVTSPDEPVQVISKAPEPTPADTLIQDTVTSPVEPVQVISKAPESTPADTLIQDTVTSPVEPVQVISKAPESTPADTLIQDTVTSPDEPVQVISKAPEPTPADTLIQDTVTSPVEPVQVISKAPESTPADTLIQDTVMSPVEPVQVISKAPEPTPADTLIQDTVTSPVEPVQAYSPSQVISKAPYESISACNQTENDNSRTTDKSSPNCTLTDDTSIGGSSDENTNDCDGMFTIKRRHLESFTDDEDRDPDYIPSDCSNIQSDSEGSIEFPLTTAKPSVESRQCNEDKSIASDTSHQENNSASDRKKHYKKPYRFCIYCKIFRSKLSDHLKKKHSDEPRVKYALSLPKGERDVEFANIKKEGTFVVNKRRVKENEASFERERGPSSLSPDDIVICGTCSGAYASSYIRKHKRLCMRKSDASKPAGKIPITLLKIPDPDSDFAYEILGKFRKDKVGRICQEDPVLLEIGKRLWSKQKKKVDKKVQVKRSVMTDMRRLASLYVIFEEMQETLGTLPIKANNISDMMQRANFRHLEEALERYTERNEETDSVTGVKAGLKLGIYYLLKSAAKILKATYLMDDNDRAAEDLDRFTAVLELQHNHMFGDATYLLNKRREEKLRRPSDQPLETDIKAIRNYTTETINDIVMDEFKFIDKHKFVELRDCVVTRLTLFNARRGGEPSRLHVSHWKDAKNGVWLDQQQLNNLDPIDRRLAQELKVGYQTGKGKHLVPILFPKDTHIALDQLISEDVRSAASVREDNTYLFPTTGTSDGHVSGWHALDNVCEKVHLENRRTITATKNRHRISVLFALADVPEAERGFIFKHLGHSAETNRNIYQAPLAVKEITVVGKQLQNMDGSGGSMGGSSAGRGSSSGGLISSTSSTSAGFDLSTSASSSFHGEGDNMERPAATRSNTSSKAESVTSSSDTGFSCSQPAPSNSGNLSDASASFSRVEKERKYTRWAREEQRKVEEHFRLYIRGEAPKKLPGKREIMEFLRANPSFPHPYGTVRNKLMNDVYNKREKKSLEIH
ncbi:uncharacterized protein LOC105437092 [Strongylocentrotus purpuratus]|uniref:SET domain-containing protein n=1 Tax=Strongylocentrotus purpuratus TaxID=7668 RepID=A0A7M7HI77_STRPU|nr:uncharacterized protein LOC105437092 [Strongylocentrotus purpuratus]XP_030830091.1 uncharacterized protein LOC105437092 [Strongylocentrotus purpuratus]